MRVHGGSKCGYMEAANAGTWRQQMRVHGGNRACNVELRPQPIESRFAATRSAGWVGNCFAQWAARSLDGGKWVLGRLDGSTSTMLSLAGSFRNSTMEKRIQPLGRLDLDGGKL